MKFAFRQLTLLGASALALSASLPATDGYLATGYGIKQQGQGGAGIALPGDSLAAATNPAGFAFIGDRFDIGLGYFRPIRSGAIVGNQLPPGYPDVNGEYSANRVTNFFIPEVGYSHQFGGRYEWGVSIFGNGGMNTSYTTPIPLLGTTRGGVDLQQLFISPTFAVKVNEHNSLGLAVNIAYQRFSAEGLENFASPNYSASPANVTNRGYDNSFGAGVRVGWLGQINRIVSLGATYQTPTFMSKLSKYSGLFAQQGGFDIPANVGVGAALHPSAKFDVLFDYERIFYGQVKSIANLGSNQALLGSDNGPGFGWQDTSVEKIGVAYKVTGGLTLRGGYNHSGVPFSNTQTFFNLLAPAVIANHIHVGATANLKKGRELSFAYIHAFGNTVNGLSSIPPNAGGGNVNLQMHQDSVGVSFGWKKE